MSFAQVMKLGAITVLFIVFLGGLIGLGFIVAALGTVVGTGLLIALFVATVAQEVWEGLRGLFKKK